MLIVFKLLNLISNFDKISMLTRDITKKIAFRVMSLVLQAAPCHSMFGADTFNTFLVMGYIKAFARQ